MNCVAAKGFLTQSDCGAPAARACAHCGRPMCTVHLAPQTGFSMCLDCAATQQPPQEQGTPTDYDGTWARGYRNTYYAATGYRPYHGGRDSYDRHDSSLFDDRGYDSPRIDAPDGGFDVS